MSRAMWQPKATCATSQSHRRWAIASPDPCSPMTNKAPLPTLFSLEPLGHHVQTDQGTCFHCFDWDAYDNIHQHVGASSFVGSGIFDHAATARIPLVVTRGAAWSPRSPMRNLTFDGSSALSTGHCLLRFSSARAPNLGVRLHNGV